MAATIRTTLQADLHALLISGPFSTAAADNLVDEQGLQSIAALGELSDKKINEMCSTTRKPGGTTTFGTPKSLKTVVGLGVKIAFCAELKLAEWANAIRQRKLCSRSTVQADLTDLEVLRWKEFVEADKEYKEPSLTDVPPVKEFERNWPRAFEAMDDYFKSLRSDKSRVPLSYIIRDDIEPKPSVDDPSSGYDDPLDELVARCPHQVALPPTPAAAAAAAAAPAGAPPAITYIKTTNYKPDNAKVWQVMSNMFLGTDNWIIIQPYCAKRDGRGAYVALKAYQLGPHNMNNMARKVEADLARLKYTGEKRRYTFDAYVKGHIRCHTIMNDLKKFKYSGIDEHTKVRRFVEGIHNSKLDSCQTRVLCEPNLFDNFSAVVTLYKDFINNNGMNAGNDDSAAQIGAVGQTNGKRKATNYINYDTTDVEVELKHYTQEEYKTLTNPQKLKLKRWREGKSDMPTGPDKAFNPNHPIMKKLEKISAAVSSNKKSDAAAKKKPAAKSGKPSNRNNKALVKQVALGDDADEDMAHG